MLHPSAPPPRLRRPARPRSQPRRFRQRNVPRAWRSRLAPDATKRRARGLPGLYTRLRRLLFAWWVWAAIAVWSAATGAWVAAGITLAVAILVHVASPQEFAPVYGLEHAMSVGSEAFVDSIVGTTGAPFVPGNRVTVLNNGDEFYPAMLDAIRAAQRSVTIEAYIYWAGEIGLVFARALAERSRAGVSVKILLDAVGSATIGTEILATLERGGCQLAWFHPIHWYTIGRFNHRTHRKTLLVDGRVGFTGGAGIADHWCGNAQDTEHWRDMQVRIEGPGIVALQTGFVTNWLATTGELVSGADFFPATPSMGDVAVQAVMSSPAIGSSAVRTLYLLSIVCAKRSIAIANPYFIPDHAALDAFADARARGVDVRVLVSGIRNDNWLARRNSVRLFGPLLDAGVAIFEYNRTMLHHKTMVVDGQWATIGTANFDNRSFALNEESNITFFDRALVARMLQTFDADVARAVRVDPEVYRRRGAWWRAQEIAASLLQDQV